ncbi:MAG: SDR family NAD(P)-dependent oxidoreductase, partial [Parvibaculum sp.]
MPGALEGKVAVITGASAGIGRAMAEIAAREGASLALGDITEAGEAVAEALRKKGTKAFFLRTDVRRKQDMDAL